MLTRIFALLLCGAFAQQIFALVLPPPPPAKTLTLRWKYPPREMEGVTFNVYVTDNLARPFRFYTNVSTLSVQVPASKSSAFYRVTAVRYGMESR